MQRKSSKFLKVICHHYPFVIRIQRKKRISNIKWILSKWKLSNVGYWWSDDSRKNVQGTVQCIQETFTSWLTATMSVPRRSKWFVWPKWNLASIDRGIACDKPSWAQWFGRRPKIWNLEFRFAIWCWCKEQMTNSEARSLGVVGVLVCMCWLVRASVFVFMLKWMLEWSGFIWCELYRNHKSIEKCWLFRLESNGCVRFRWVGQNAAKWEVCRFFSFDKL